MTTKPNNKNDKISHQECIDDHMETAASIVNDDAKWKEFIEELRKEGGLTSMALRQALASAAVKRVSLKSKKKCDANNEDDDASTASTTSTSIFEETKSKTEKSEKSAEEKEEQATMKFLLKQTSDRVSGLCSLASMMSEAESPKSNSSNDRRASLGRRLWSVSDLDSLGPTPLNLASNEKLLSCTEGDEQEDNRDLSKLLASALALGGLSDLFEDELEDD